MNDAIVSQISALGRTVSKLVADAAVLQAQYDALVRETTISSLRVPESVRAERVRQEARVRIEAERQAYDLPLPYGLGEPNDRDMVPGLVA